MIRSPKTGKSYNSKADKEIKSFLVDRTGKSLNFMFALEFLKVGEKVYRLSWNEKNSYVFIKNGFLLHNKPHHKNQKKMVGGYPYVINEEDIFADDWIVLT